MPNKKEKMPTKEEKLIEFKIAKEISDSRNESFEKTLNNIYALTVFIVKSYGRLGYQIKVQEQILDELKKLNQGK